jgi:hypothetical protein
VTAVALAGRWPSLLPWGIVGVGAGYTVFLGLRGAAALFAAAELAFWSLEPRHDWSEPAVVVRRVMFVCVGALGTALVGALLLVGVAGTSGGVGYEALGVGAAVLTLAIVALLTMRSRDSSPGS